VSALSGGEVGYKVELDVFEGPLDLLLHLVKKHELEILDIPISFITEKYLEYLDFMQALSLDIAGEYLVMAATLAHIKSRELLPSPEPLPGEGEDGDDEGEDPRQELIRRLLEYQKYKEAALELDQRPVVGRNVWPRGARQKDALLGVDPHAAAPLAEVPVTKLIEAFDRVLSKARVNVAHTVDIDQLSVSERMGHLVDRLEVEGSFTFTSCFSFLTDGIPASLAQAKHEAVVTFLALLEMAKLGLIRITQAEGDDEEIAIARAAVDLRERLRTTVSTGDDDYR
jgi:segregation and condensation protein A